MSASKGNQRRKGPGRISEGGATFRPLDRRQGPDIHEALGLQRAGLLIGACGDSMSRSKVFGGFTLAQWLTTLTGESPTSFAWVTRPERKGRPIRLAEKADRRDGAYVSPGD